MDRGFIKQFIFCVYQVYNPEKTVKAEHRGSGVEFSLEDGFGVKHNSFAFGVCYKKKGWIISVYRHVSDPYNIVKIRKTEEPTQNGTTYHLNDEPSKPLNEASAKKKLRE